MRERLPEFRIEEADGALRVTDNSIQDAVLDLMKRLTDAREAALKAAIKSLGWIAPEDIAAHDASIASEAAEGALREAAEYLTVKTVDPAYEGMSNDGEFGSGFYQGIRSTRRALRSRAERLRAEREGAGEGES